MKRFSLFAVLALAAPAPAAEPELPSLPVAVSSFGAAVCDGHLYVYGGHSGKTHTYSTEAVVGTFRRLKLDGGTAWEDLPGGPPSQGLALVEYRGRLYRVGGMQPRNEPDTPADNHSLASCAVFDPKTGEWSDLPDLPAGRSSHDAVVLGDTLYVVGGWRMNGKGEASVWHDTALTLDLTKDEPEWVSVEQPFRRRALTAAAFEGKVYVFGGMSDTELERDVDVYDPATGKWSEGPALPGLRRNSFSPASCVADGRLLICPADGTLYRLDEAGERWEPVGELEHKRLVHRMLPVGGGRVAVLGGGSRDGNVAVTEVLSPVSADAPGAAAPAKVWPGFRGRGDGRAAAGGLPEGWSPTENVAWKAELPGYGQSAPVVWGGRVFVTAVEGEQRERGFVAAFDAATGERAWLYEFEPSQKAKWSYTISRAAPTPVADAEGVYCFFEGGNLIALDHDGNERWARSLVEEYGEFQNGHGLGGSPAQTDGAVVVLIDHQGPSYLLAADKATGKTLWKTERASRTSWTSPVMARVDGRDLVIASSNGSVAAYDAADGKLLWELTGLSGNTLPSATVSGDTVVVGGGISSRRGGTSPAPAEPSNACLSLTSDEGKPGFEVRWKADRINVSYATPLVHEGHVYFVNQVGVVTCVDAKTGEKRYEERTAAGGCWASPIGAGDRVYFFGKDGVSAVLKAGPEFDPLAENRLWVADKPAPAEGQAPSGDYLDPILYGAAAADGALFLRTGSALYRIGGS